MEVNRDEAERCIDIATAALTSNRPDKAQRFLEKAQRLFPTEKAKGELKWPSRFEVRGASAGDVRSSITGSITCIPDELCGAYSRGL